MAQLMCRAGAAFRSLVGTASRHANGSSRLYLTAIKRQEPNYFLESVLDEAPHFRPQRTAGFSSTAAFANTKEQPHPPAPGTASSKLREQLEALASTGGAETALSILKDSQVAIGGNSLGPQGASLVASGAGVPTGLENAVVMHGAIIAGCARAGDAQGALKALDVLIGVASSNPTAEGAVPPTRNTKSKGEARQTRGAGAALIPVRVWGDALKACAMASQPGLASAVIDKMAASGVQPDARCYNFLAASCGDDVDKAEAVVSLMRAAGLTPTLMTYNTLVAACARAGRLRRGFALIAGMQRDKVLPTTATFNSLIAACCHRETLLSPAPATPSLSPASRSSYTAGSSTAEWLTSGAPPQGLSSGGHSPTPMAIATRLYQLMQEMDVAPDSYTFNALMAGHGHRGDLAACFGVLADMAAAQVAPTALTMNAALTACARQRDVGTALWLYRSMAAPGGVRGRELAQAANQFQQSQPISHGGGGSASASMPSSSSSSSPIFSSPASSTANKRAPSLSPRVQPNAATFTTLMRVCAAAGDARAARLVLREARHVLLPPTTSSLPSPSTAPLTATSGAAALPHAGELYHSLLEACVGAGDHQLAFATLDKLLADASVTPTAETFALVTRACAGGGGWGEGFLASGSEREEEDDDDDVANTSGGGAGSGGQARHLDNINAGAAALQGNLQGSSGSSRVGGGKPGSPHGGDKAALSRAWSLVRRGGVMESAGVAPTAATFTALIEVCGRRGDLLGASHALREMRRRGILPDAGAYFAYLCGCAAGGNAARALGMLEEVSDRIKRGMDVSAMLPSWPLSSPPPTPSSSSSSSQPSPEAGPLSASVKAPSAASGATSSRSPPTALSSPSSPPRGAGRSSPSPGPSPSISARGPGNPVAGINATAGGGAAVEKRGKQAATGSSSSLLPAEDAMATLSALLAPDTLAHKLLLHACAVTGASEVALSTLDAMAQGGLERDELAFYLAAAACRAAGDSEGAFEALGMMRNERNPSAQVRIMSHARGGGGGAGAGNTNGSISAASMSPSSRSGTASADHSAAAPGAGSHPRDQPWKGLSGPALDAARVMGDGVTFADGQGGLGGVNGDAGVDASEAYDANTGMVAQFGNMVPSRDMFHEVLGACGANTDRALALVTGPMAASRVTPDRATYGLLLAACQVAARAALVGGGGPDLARGVDSDLGRGGGDAAEVLSGGDMGEEGGESGEKLGDATEGVVLRGGGVEGHRSPGGKRHGGGSGRVDAAIGNDGKQMEEDEDEEDEEDEEGEGERDEGEEGFLDSLDTGGSANPSQQGSSRRGRKTLASVAAAASAVLSAMDDAGMRVDLETGLRMLELFAGAGDTRGVSDVMARVWDPSNTLVDARVAAAVVRGFANAGDAAAARDVVARWEWERAGGSGGRAGDEGGFQGRVGRAEGSSGGAASGTSMSKPSSYTGGGGAMEAWSRVGRKAAASNGSPCSTLTACPSRGCITSWRVRARWRATRRACARRWRGWRRSIPC
eukprot:jgi/Mesvir1/26058/Mv11188-RA.1